MAGSKRSLEFDDVSSIKNEAQDVVVHGRILGLSPVKQSKKNEKIRYFNCELTDGKKTCRLVSFEPKVRNEFEQFMEAEEAVAVQNCDIKKSKFGPGYEVVLSQKSSVVSSPKRFKVDQVELEKSVGMLSKLMELTDIAANMGNKVSVQGKILSAEKEVQSITTADKRSYVKRDYVISDSSYACRMVMWEGLVNSIEIGKCYLITQVGVKAYNGEKYFSSTDQSEVKEIADIGEVTESQANAVGLEDFVGEIIGIVSCTKFISCVSCAGKVEDESSSSCIGICGKCGLKQKLNKCQTKRIARVMIEIEKTREKKTVTIFNDVLNELVRMEDDESSGIEIKLLEVPPKLFSIRNNIVKSVSDISLE